MNLKELASQLDNLQQAKYALKKAEADLKYAKNGDERNGMLPASKIQISILENTVTFLTSAVKGLEETDVTAHYAALNIDDISF